MNQILEVGERARQDGVKGKAIARSGTIKLKALALGALRDTLRDADERVRQAAQMAIEFIETGQEPPWVVMV